jgi:hypothetical protein
LIGRAVEAALQNEGYPDVSREDRDLYDKNPCTKSGENLPYLHFKVKGDGVQLASN